MISKTEWVLDHAQSLERWVPQTDADRQAVRDHLKSIVASPFFNTSKRYPTLLGHVVEASLDGRPANLKERTLGIEIFHRDPMYDTSSDPVVRTTACEVRKRLNQYYHEFGKEEDIRIELPQGSYVPEFRRKNPYRSMTEDGLQSANEEGHTNPVRPLAVAQRMSFKLGYLGLAITLVLGIAIGITATQLPPSPRSSATEEFWRPLLDSSGTVLVCMGEVYASEIDIKPNGSRNRFDLPVAWTGPPRPGAPFAVASIRDSIALANLAAWLKEQRKSYVIQGASATTFSALGKGPAVLVGAFSNDWTIRLSDQLRYHFDMDPNTGEAWIADREKPSEKLGVRLRGMAPPQADEYSLISRVYDPTTHQTILAVAGVSGGGTGVAVDFVTSPTALADFSKQAPAGWQNRNIQLVISASNVDRSLGSPRVVASYVW